MCGAHGLPVLIVLDVTGTRRVRHCNSRQLATSPLSPTVLPLFQYSFDTVLHRFRLVQAIVSCSQEPVQCLVSVSTARLDRVGHLL